MARKKKKVEEKEIIYAPIDEQPITETLEQNYMPYAMKRYRIESNSGNRRT